MSKHKNIKTRTKARAEPARTRNVVWFTDPNHFDTLECQGYTTLAHNPEVSAGVDTIARLIGAMTIHLMENTDQGDVRVVNELSRMVDITPNRYMTRSNFITWIVKQMYLDGNGNAVVYPVTEDGYLRELRPIPPAFASFIPDGFFDYRVYIAGMPFDPENLLHFVLNPSSYYSWLGTGYAVSLSAVANNLKQAAATEKGFMSSKWKPSLIVKVDAMTEEFSGVKGRQKLLESYAMSGEAGEPWLIPAEQFSVEQVKPLTLSDLALADFVKLDKTTVATILGVPPFVLGVGAFKSDEWNSFINTTIMPIAKNIEQELTRKLLYSNRMFFRFNARSLYNYNLKDLARVADDQYVRGIMTANEARDWLGLEPKEGLDELVILENYIPRGMIADQSKLIQEGGEGE